MDFYKYIFVVLVYKNIKVLQDFFTNFYLSDSHIIIVNSFYDDITSESCKRIANKYNATFIEIPNKGYGYGNNTGVEYALNKFSFDFLIISNSDIIIKKWDNTDRYIGKNVIIAPKITATSLNNKSQNPNIVRFSRMFYYNFLRKGYERNNKYLKILAHIYSRLTREIYEKTSFLRKNGNLNIFSAHGSFIMFTSAAVKTLNPIFNDEMFLYNEELYLAFRCRQLNIPIVFDEKFQILHLEGASSGSGLNEENKKSFIILDNYVKHNNLL